MIYVFNPSPSLLQISVNHVPVANAVAALSTPPYTPASMAIPYGPTGEPPNGYPITQPHFVPASNQLFTQYFSLDPDQPILGLEFTFNFGLTVPVLEELILYCCRNTLFVLDQFGAPLYVVRASANQEKST